MDNRSKRPYFWAQSASRDMFTQAVARNMVAISKQEKDPAKKQGAGPLLAPTPEIGMGMAQERRDVISGYQRSVGYHRRDEEAYGGLARQKEALIRGTEALGNQAGDHETQQRMMRDRHENVRDLWELREKASSFAQQRIMTSQKLHAARHTQVSWPGHKRWDSIKQEMADKPSKLLTLGHGRAKYPGVATSFMGETAHTFEDIVKSQVASGLPLDKTAKRLDSCYAAAEPLKPGTVKNIRQNEAEGKMDAPFRRHILKAASSTQQFAQAYHDQGVLNPDVTGVSKENARFPNTLRSTYRNEVTLADQSRAPRAQHKATHEPIFRGRGD